MSAPRSTQERWGPRSSQSTRAKSPLWFRAWSAWIVLAWCASGPALPRFILIVGGGLLLALLIQAGIQASTHERSPSRRLAGSPDPLRAVLEESARHGDGVYLGTDEDGRWQTARPERAVLVLGPPRSGKSSAVMIPALLAHLGPAVSTSTKSDVLTASVSARSRLGNVWRFDPTGSDPAPAGTSCAGLRSRPPAAGTGR